MNTLAPSRPSQEITQSRRIGFLIFPDCEIIDLCGPFEAFYYGDFWLARFGRTNERGYQCDILAAVPGPVRTMSGIEIVATQCCYDLGDGLDTLVVVGGIGTVQACKDKALIEWVRSTAPRVRRVASVCTGAFILAAAGLLNHRRATTHWLFSEGLAMEYPSIQVDSNLMFVRDGNIYTSGGITAGIDLDLGREIALAVARTMVVFPRRPGGAVPVQRVCEIGSEEPARYQRIASLDPGAPGGGSQRIRLGGPHGHEFRAILLGSFAARPGRRRRILPNGRGPMRPALNSNKRSCRSRASPRNVASAMPNACGAPFSAFSMSVRTITGRGSDHLCSPDFYDRTRCGAPPLNRGRGGNDLRQSIRAMRLFRRILARNAPESLL